MCNTYKKKFEIAVFLLFGMFCTVTSVGVANDVHDKTPMIYTIVIYAILLVTSIIFRHRLPSPKWSNGLSSEIVEFVALAFITLVAYLIYWIFLIIFIKNFHDDFSGNDTYLMLGCSIVT